MRVLAGYWTHGGYLNWDTGFGFERWHQAKKLGLSQQALIGIASAPALAPRPSRARLGEVDARPRLRRLRAPARPQRRRAAGAALRRQRGAAADRERAARARADDLQRGPRDRRRARLRAGAQEPPPLYSFDPDTGRLAVTTPVVQHGDRAERRGARIRTAGSTSRGSTTGARRSRPGSAAARRHRSGCSCATSPAGARSPPSSRTAAGCGSRGRRSASGRGPPPGRAAPTPARSATCARRAGARRAAGPAGRAIASRTSFVQTSWSLSRTGASGRATVDVLFPSWGADARVTAVLRDGGTRRVGSVRFPDFAASRTCWWRASTARTSWSHAAPARRDGAPAAHASARARRRSPDRRSRCSWCGEGGRGPRGSARATRPWNANGPRRPRPAWQGEW